MDHLYKDTVRKTKYLEAYGLEVEQMWECELREEMEKDEEMNSGGARGGARGGKCPPKIIFCPPILPPQFLIISVETISR